MLAAKSLLLIASTVAAIAVPPSLISHKDAKYLMRRAVTPSSQGQNNGFFYSMWSDGTGDVQYKNGDAGEYSLTWSNSGDVVVGKGFNPGTDRTINYQADYQPQGISFLSVYGWFKDPLVEYYITESWGTGNPGQGDGMNKLGSFESDGGTYDVFEHQQVNAPSIQGTTNFKQYWSIRTEKRTSGTITVANHWNEWKKLGLQIGTPDYQIVATEGVKSSGSSDVTVSEGAASNAGTDSGSAAASSSSAAAPPAASSSTAAAPVPESSAPAEPSMPAAPSMPAVPSMPAGAPYAFPGVSAADSSETATNAASSYPESTAPSAPSDVPSTPSVPAGSSAATPPAYTPSASASAPFGAGPSLPHYTPVATPTPRWGHHHHGHHGGYPYFGGFPHHEGAPNAAGSGAGAPYAPIAGGAAAPTPSAAVSAASDEGDDC
ncbi:MAG: hypothetical protein Q9159_001131 [Coniocarpon cinnabarinum]